MANEAMMNLMQVVHSSLFYGNKESDKPKLGDTICKDGNLYTYCGSEWIDIGTSEEKSEPTVKMVAPHICTQCAAPIPKGSNKCIFCDTEFY